jgi:hypothetical protein
MLKQTLLLMHMEVGETLLLMTLARGTLFAQRGRTHDSKIALALLILGLLNLSSRARGLQPSLPLFFLPKGELGPQNFSTPNPRQTTSGPMLSFPCAASLVLFADF